MKKFTTSIGFVITMFSCLANAIAPAHDVDIFCSSSHVVIAKIDELSSKPESCFEGMYCRCKVEAVIEIEAVLGIEKSVLAYPEDVGISQGKKVLINTSVAQYPPVPLTSESCQDLRPTLIGAKRIVTISTTYGPWGDGTTHVSRPPYWATFWTLDKQEWVNNVLLKSDGVGCPSSGIKAK